MYNSVDDIVSSAKLCDKCEGSGYLNENNYFENEVCFQCFGQGVINP